MEEKMRREKTVFLAITVALIFITSSLMHYRINLSIAVFCIILASLLAYSAVRLAKILSMELQAASPAEKREAVVANCIYVSIGFLMVCLASAGVQILLIILLSGYVALFFVYSSINPVPLSGESDGDGGFSDER